MPHKVNPINKDIRADKALITNEQTVVTEGRGVSFLCIGEKNPIHSRCAEFQIAEGAPRTHTLPCETRCIAKFIRQNKKSRRIVKEA